MIGSAVALVLMSLDGVLTQVEGALLLLAAVLYTALVVRESRRESIAVKREFSQQLGTKAVLVDRSHLRFAWHSAPELATTLVSTYKNDRDVAIGNLIGSSIYNVLVILGLTMLVAPSGVEVQRDLLWIDLPLAAIVAAVCLPVFRSGGEVSRKEGAVFVAAYLVYLTALVTLRN